MCDKIAYRVMETAGRIVIALNDGSCMATWYIVMLEPAAGAGTRKQIDSIPVFFFFFFDSFIFNPLHAARRAMAAAVPLPHSEQRQAF